MNRQPAKQAEKNANAALPRRKRRVRKRSVATERFFAVLITFLTAFIVFSLLVCLLIYIDYNRVSDSSGLYGLAFKYNGSTVTSVSAGKANNNYGLYVPYKCLSQIATISVVGDDTAVSFICLPEESSIKCSANSTLVYINGSAVRLSAPVLFDDSDYYMPIELVENYIFGLTVTYRESSQTCIIEHGDGDITLKMAPTAEMAKTYFPESYKIYQ